MIKLLFRLIFNTNQKFRIYLALHYCLEDVLSFNSNDCYKVMKNYLEENS